MKSLFYFYFYLYIDAMLVLGLYLTYSGFGA